MTSKEQDIPDLNEKQKHILEKFLEEFLPATENKRKYSTNEIYYLRSTLGLFFKQNFSFDISTKELVKIFNDLEYTIFKKRNRMNFESKKIVPHSNSELWTGKETDLDYYSNFIYIDVAPIVVKNIKRACSKLPKNTSELVLNENELFKKKLIEFVDKNKSVYTN